jgi:hypothetical protein
MVPWKYRGSTKVSSNSSGQPAFAHHQHARGEVRVVVFGQDQKATVVGDQVQPIVLMAKIPPDPGITGGALPGRRREAQQRQPLAVPGSDIPQGVPDLRQRAQVVMGIHQRLEARLLGRGDGVEDDLAKVHVGGLGQRGTDALYPRRTGHCPAWLTTAGCKSES